MRSGALCSAVLVAAFAGVLVVMVCCATWGVWVNMRVGCVCWGVSEERGWVDEERL